MNSLGHWVHQNDTLLSYSASWNMVQLLDITWNRDLNLRSDALRILLAWGAANNTYHQWRLEWHVNGHRQSRLHSGSLVCSLPGWSSPRWTAARDQSTATKKRRKGVLKHKFFLSLSIHGMITSFHTSMCACMPFNSEINTSHPRMWNSMERKFHMRDLVNQLSDWFAIGTFSLGRPPPQKGGGSLAYLESQPPKLNWPFTINAAIRYFLHCVNSLKVKTVIHLELVKVVSWVNPLMCSISANLCPVKK